MKQLFLALLAGVLANVAAQAQGPIYLLYNNNCMNQLEYRFPYSGSTVLAYTLNFTPNQQTVLTSGSSGISSPTLPANVLDCASIKADQTFLDAINKNQKQVYMVHQTQNGYLLMPIISAIQIERNGTYYFFRGGNYMFALDTLNLTFQSNLATAGSPSKVYFNGLKTIGCMYQYSFRREPLDPTTEKADFDFVPGVGIVQERSGNTPQQAESNQMRLWFVNGMGLEDYINASCYKNGNTSAPIVQPPGASNANLNYNKEIASAPAASAPGANLPPLANCPERPSTGVHIAQRGETMMAIARAYNVTLRDLVKWNNLANPNNLDVCQRVFVTDPSKPGFVTSKSARAVNPPGPVAQSQEAYWDQGLAVVGPPPAVTPGGNALPPALHNQTAPDAPPVHVVQKGETVSGIARKYGYTEDRFRRMNNFPATGEVIIYPGQKLVVSDCDTGDPYVQPQAPTAIQPEISSHPGMKNQPQGGVAPVIHNQTPENPTPTITQSVRKAPFYKEYVVQQGDTMNSIAIKFKTNVQELCLLNNKEANETLIAGQRLLIPQ